MRLVSWNVAGRTDGSRAPALSGGPVIAGERPDVVALQEVTCTSEKQWRERLPELGLAHIASTVSLASDRRRRNANLLAARWPLKLEPPAARYRFPERILSAGLEAPAGAVELHVFHAPTGVGSGWEKVRALEAVHTRLTEAPAASRIVCGDFNAPQAEPPDRPLVTFARIPRASSYSTDRRGGTSCRTCPRRGTRSGGIAPSARC